MSRSILERYRRAEQLLNRNIGPLGYNVRVEPHWLPNGSRFWCKSETPQGVTFWLVDPAQGGSRSQLFDHAALATMLGDALGRAVSAARLPIDDLRVSSDGELETITTTGGAVWSVDPALRKLSKKRDPYPEDYAVSPDDRFALFRKNFDLYLVEPATGLETRLTYDGGVDCEYGIPPTAQLFQVTLAITGARLAPSVGWSPGGRFACTHRRRTRGVGRSHLIQTSPAGGGGPRLFSYSLAVPGDECVPELDYLLIDLSSKTLATLASTLDNASNPLDARTLWWGPDGRLFYTLVERGFRALSLHCIDPVTQNTQQILAESDSVALQLFLPEDTHPAGRAVEGSDEVVWSSQRGGWMHLYLYAGEARPRQLTKGNWNVRDIVAIDAKNRWAYVSASGRETGRNPYRRHLYRLSLDGSEPMLLTPEDADHDVSIAPSLDYFVDTLSTVDSLPRTIVRNAEGEKIADLETADLSRAFAAGWTFPEPFVAKAADGITELYGIMLKPSDFDPAQRYPVIDAIYAGPQSNRVPSGFVWPDADARAAHNEHPLAELGFIVVMLDARGTPNRSKEFQWSILGERFGKTEFIDDHVAVIRQLAERHAYVDVDRVGIYGQSAGGYASVRGMLQHPRFFKVGVSAEGNHDQRRYLWTWGEKYIGDLARAAWSEQDNVELAARLEGKLLLMIPELDDNVPPALAYRLIDAFIRADKDFDLAVVPNTNHLWRDVTEPLKKSADATSPVAHPYVIRRRWDYFVRHLRGETPPAGFEIAARR